MRAQILPLVMLAACMVSAGAHARQVALRGGESVNAAVLEASLTGLKIAPESQGAPARLYSWDLIKQVPGDAGAAAKPFEQIADRLWRARIRVERGDYPGAEPLLDSLSETYAAEAGPSAALVAECLVRCRLARGAQGSAVVAWLWSMRIGEQHAGGGANAAKPAPTTWVGGSTGLPRIIDPETGLSPQLPPVWAPGTSTNAVAISPEWSRVRAYGGASATLAELYEKAARFEAGLETEISVTPGASESAGLALVRDVVISRAGDAEAREHARQRLEERLAAIAARAGDSKAKSPPTPRWVEAWCRIAVGRSLIRETDQAMQMRGVIHLLHLPARFAADQPQLAAIALADAAVTMEAVGDHRAALALKADLQTGFPGHPILDWEPVRRIVQDKNAQTHGRSGSAPIAILTSRRPMARAGNSKGSA